jgi:hypothetical protein
MELRAGGFRENKPVTGGSIASGLRNILSAVLLNIPSRPEGVRPCLRADPRASSLPWKRFLSVLSFFSVVKITKRSGAPHNKNTILLKLRM